MRVELIYDTGCPNVEETRTNLLRAFAAAHLKPKWAEWERSSRLSPAYAGRFGSPTVLVEGRDVAGEDPRDNLSCCRLYASADGRYRGAPSAEIIRAACTRPAPGSSEKWKQNIFAIPGIVLSVLPFGGCPACWPVYAGFLSTVGLGFLLSADYLLPLTALFLFVTVFTLVFRARRRCGYGPFVLGLVAALFIVWTKFSLESNVLSDAGVGLLICSFLWNNWPRPAASKCPRCAPSGTQFVN